MPVRYTVDARSSGLGSRTAAPADLQATAAGDIQNRLLARRKTSCDGTNSNQLTAYSSMLNDQLALHIFPRGAYGSQPGQYLTPSQLLSIATTSRHPTEAGVLINGLLTDPEMTAILGSERGIPPTTAVRAAVKPNAGATERATDDHIGFVADKVGPLPPPAPARGATYPARSSPPPQSIALDKATIDQTVARFFDDSAHALRS